MDGGGTDLMDRVRTRVSHDAVRRFHDRFGGWGGMAPLSNRQRLVALSRRVGNLVGLRGTVPDPGERLSELAELADGLAHTESLLHDEGSRRTFLTVLALRVLGPEYVDLVVNERDLRDRIARFERERRVASAVRHTADGHPLHRYRFPHAGNEMELVGAAFLIEEIFGVRQYVLDDPPLRVRAETGDVVIDGGGGYGETALFFADAVGASGRVLSCEFVPGNLDILNENLASNPHVSDRVEVIASPLWDVVGEQVDYAVAGGMSSLVDSSHHARATATTTTIDTVCRERAIERIDFLKLDVEGAELRTLRGARQMIEASRPKLAISVYHYDRDLVDIPAWIDGLGLGYRFHLQHLWPNASETMLFAHAPE
jgi:FkbM family methyltransferase